MTYKQVQQQDPDQSRPPQPKPISSEPGPSSSPGPAKPIVRDPVITTEPPVRTTLTRKESQGKILKPRDHNQQETPLSKPRQFLKTNRPRAKPLMS